jgi:hypothetical protein
MVGGMTRTQCCTATSADGFIADEHTSLDWLFEVGRGVGLMAMGATTYQWVLDVRRSGG